ncbi:VOC family protein [Gilvimarinus sp. F26214L]|uniref:VOC family protein n=1 Tax=Gilvimarinus sp. DZF01 TaxID=3461371 RepID=UPI0040456524
MIGYITLGTNDREKANAFYDQLFALMGAQRVLELEKLTFWGRSRKEPVVAVGTPYDEQAATHGNGSMVSLTVASKAQVDDVYRKALELGGADEGEPGNRTEDFYGAYFRDLDNNKICVFCMV